MAQQTQPGAVKTDGRKRRWHQHKVERRNELVDGTLVAIRRRGSNVSMDEIAAEIGVSKTVLYRYFVDKNDLTTAVMMRFAQTTLIPNMAAALSSNLDGYDLTREILRAIALRRPRFEGEIACRGQCTSIDCKRVLRYIGTATYRESSSAAAGPFSHETTTR